MNKVNVKHCMGILGLVLLMLACAPFGALLPTNTPSPTQTPIPTWTPTSTSTPTPEPGTGEIIGRVLDSTNGSAVPAANISTDPPTSSITADTLGDYSISEVPPGDYTVIASKSGYTSVSVGIAVVAGKKTTADLHLLPVQTEIAPGSALSLTDGLVAYYPFDGSAEDASGNGHNGKIYGDPQVIPGIRGYAFRFDGDDHIEVENAQDFEPGRGDCSVAVWVRYREGATEHRVFIVSHPAGFRWIQISGDALKDDIRFGLKSGTNAAQTVARYTPIQDNEWHQIVGVREDVHTVRLYVDAELVDTLYNTNLGYVETYSVNPLYIGLDPTYGDHYNDGDIDELRFYDRALTDAEVQALYYLR